MSVWNISANYVLVPLSFNLNWNIWNPFLKTPPLDFSGQRLGNTSLVVFLRFHSFSQVVKWPEFVSLYTTNSWYVSTSYPNWQRCGLSFVRSRVHSRPASLYCKVYFSFQCAFYQAKVIILEKTLNQNYPWIFYRSLAHDAARSRVLRLENWMIEPLCYEVLQTADSIF